MSAAASQKIMSTSDFLTLDRWERFSENSPALEEEASVELIAGVYFPTPPSEITTIGPEPAEEFDTFWEATSGGEGLPDLRATGANIKPGQEWFWSEEWQAAEREVEADLAAGRFETFDTMEEFLKSLE